MYRLVESIKLQNRKLQNIEWHNKRFNETRNQLFGINEEVDLEQLIAVPDSLLNDVYKCRVLYGKQIEAVEFQLYTPKNVSTLQLVEGNDIAYAYKYENRFAFDRLMTMKGYADDILIVRDDHITDTSYSNIVFFDGKKWMTPDTFLLNGTQRQRLLAEGIITEAKISPSELKNFTAAKPINAMLDFETTSLVSIFY
ncbi:MAG: aminotransferase class IV [Bacteroidales bacterium]|nr:aminotransferase class IV [Bacteroidales bacterium]